MDTKAKKLRKIVIIAAVLVLIAQFYFAIIPQKAKALSWEKVLDMNTLGLTDNDGLFRFQEFKGKLYAGTYTNNESAQAQLWVTSDGQNWAQVTGYSSVYQGITAIEVFGDYLYVSAIPSSIAVEGLILLKR